MGDPGFPLAGRVAAAAAALALGVALGAILSATALPEGPAAAGSGAAAEAARNLRLLGALDAGAPVALLLLLAAILYATAAGLVRLAGPARPEARAAARAWAAAVGAAVAGQCAGLLSGAAIPGTGSAFLAGGAASALLLHFAGARPGAAVGPRGGSLRALGLLLCALVLSVPAGTLDLLLHGLLGVPVLPEAWFVVASSAGAGWFRPGAAGVLAVGAVGALALERRGAGVAPRSLAAGAILRAPVLAVLMGPSHPFRAAGAGLALAAMERAGVPLPLRAALVPILVAALAILALAS